MNKILFLGPIGTYSYVVAVELQKILSNYDLVSKKTFYDIHIDILSNKKNIAVLPIENSITTNVYENIEFIFDNEINIIGEYYLPIKLNLIGKKSINIDLNDTNIIKNVFSHPKALKQSSNFIQKYNFNIIESSSTAESQKIILTLDDNNFSISNYPLFDELEVKVENIGNFKNNKTRFIFITKDNIFLPNSTNKKISFLCKLKHQTGSLFYFLKEISNFNINMTKIESKPIPDSDFEYSFLIEGISNNKIEYKEIKNLLNNNTLENKILGIY